MATNPMQRKARNSFFMGVLLTLLITGAIILFLGYLLVGMKKEAETTAQKLDKVYILTKSVKSGEPIDMNFVIMDVTEEHRPIDYKISGISDKIAKIDISAGTILSEAMLTEDVQKLTADARVYEYNMLTLPALIDVDDYVDVRLMLASGVDYIVISKKRVMNLDENTIWFQLTEDEILTMSNAIVESYIMAGSNIYVAKYVEPGNQKEAIPTYPVSEAVLRLIYDDPNIVAEAQSALRNRYNNAQIHQRNNEINGALETYSDTSKEAIEAKIREQNEKAKQLRAKYLDTL